jgi:hypothetical protein
MSPPEPLSPLKPAWRCLLFSLPLVVFFGVPAAVLWLGGEFADPQTVAARLTAPGTGVLHGPAYTGSAQFVRMQSLARQRRIDVLAVGNSRVLPFRSEFFLPSVHFFNAGHTVVRIGDFRALLERMPPGARPRTLIIATEASFFLPSADRMTDKHPMVLATRQQLETTPPLTQIYRANVCRVWADLVSGKIGVARLLSGRGRTDRLGLQALIKDQGFRADGSLQYGGIENHIDDPRHRDYQFAGTLRIVRAGEGRFGWSAHPSERALQESERLFSYCQEHAIDVIAFMPPHAHAVFEAMRQLGDKYAYVKEVEQRLRAQAAAHGFEFYDFSDLAALGAPDREAIDGYHGSERAYLRMMIIMLERGSRLNAVADLDRLREVLASSTGISGLDFGGR